MLTYKCIILNEVVTRLWYQRSKYKLQVSHPPIIKKEVSCAWDKKERVKPAHEGAFSRPNTNKQLYLL